MLAKSGISSQSLEANVKEDSQGLPQSTAYCSTQARTQADPCRIHVSLAPTFMHFHHAKGGTSPARQVAVTPLLKQANSSKVVTAFSDCRPHSPPHCCYCTTHNHLTKPQEAKASGASPPAEHQQLPQRHHPRTSLPVLALKPVSMPIQGLAHHFQSQSWTGPRYPRNHLFQNSPSSNFTSQQAMASATVLGLLNRGCGALVHNLGEDPAHSEPVRKGKNHCFQSNILKQTGPCILSGNFNHHRCQKNVEKCIQLSKV